LSACIPGATPLAVADGGAADLTRRGAAAVAGDVRPVRRGEGFERGFRVGLME
jgi:hypothetical protein